MSPTNSSPAGAAPCNREVWKALEPFVAQKPPPFQTVEELRAFTAASCHTLFRLGPDAQGIQQTRFETTSADGTVVSLVRFSTVEQQVVAGSSGSDGGARRERLPAVVFVHGGGTIACSVDIYAPAVARQAQATGVQHWAVEYRLAPEHPFPAAVEDCFAALRFLSERAAELGLDPARIGLAGDSAGGGIAAGTALLARDRGLTPPLAKLVLVYPMLDDRTATRIPPGGEGPRGPFFTWTALDNVLAWDAYLGGGHHQKAGAGKGAGKGAEIGKAGENENVSPYAAPARAQSLAGLPSTYMDVGGLDLFRDECLDFAARLARDGVDAEFHLYPGVPHVFEAAVGAEAVELAWRLRGRALTSF